MIDPRLLKAATTACSAFAEAFREMAAEAENVTTIEVSKGFENGMK